MEKKEFIDEIYKKSINGILDGINDEYKKDVCYGYYNHLQKLYEESDANSENPQKLIDLFAKTEVEQWEGYDPEQKLTEYVKDEALENIRYISSTGLKYAEMMLKSKYSEDGEVLSEPVIDETKANESIELMRKYLPLVKTFNQNMANYFVSEGTLDFEFASGITEKMSLRVGRMKN